MHMTGSEALRPLELRLLCRISWIPTKSVAAQLGAIFEAADRKLSESIFDEVALSRCEQVVPRRSFLPKHWFWPVSV